MVDKITIDRSIEEALGKQKIGELQKETKENLGAHKEEIVDAISVVEGHAKSNKLLNILQVAEVGLNLKRDQEEADNARATRDSFKHQVKHNQGARQSRSRIEGGIKDIKDMLGGEQPRATQTEQLADQFATVAAGSVGGKNKDQINANVIMKSFGDVMGSRNLEDLGTELEGLDRDVLNEFTRSMDKISKIGLEGKLGELDKVDSQGRTTRGRAEAAAKAAGIEGIDFSSNVNSIEAMKQTGPGTSKETREAFKSFRDKADERRLTKPMAKGGFTSGVDTESWPEKQYEVLTEILDILERWNKSAFGDDSGGGSNTPVLRNSRNNATKGPNKTTTTTKPPAKLVGRDPKTGRFTKLPASAQPGAAIPTPKAGGGLFSKIGNVASKGANAVQGTAQKALNFMGGNSTSAKVLRRGGFVLGGVMSAYDEKQEFERDKAQAIADSQLEKTDADFLSEEALDSQLDKEANEGIGGVGGALGGAYLGAKGGAAIGTMLGGPVGTVVGGIVGGGIGYMAGTSAGSAIGKALTFDSDAMNAAQDSGLYNKNWIGDSQVDMDMVKAAPTEQLQAIIQDEDISEDIENRLRDEIDKRSRDFGPDYDTTAPMLQVAENAKAVNLETGNAIENTQVALEEAQDAKEILISTNTVTNNKVEKTTQEIIPVATPGMTTTSNDSLLQKANVIPLVMT